MYFQKIADAASNMTLTTPTAKYVSLDSVIDPIVKLFQNTRETNGAVSFIGNGGSAAIAMHMTVDFMKNGSFCVNNFFNPATLTCLSNDFGYEYVFSKQIESAISGEGVNNLLVAISSSGESENILRAVDAAKAKYWQILTLSGFKESNSLKRAGFFNVHIPSVEYGIVESLHNMILQQVVDVLKKI